MKQQLVLSAFLRDKREPINKIRRSGSVPGVLYGHKVENVLLTLPGVEFGKVYSHAGENTIIDLVIDKKEPVKVLIHDVAHHVVSNAIEHVDLYQVRMDEKIDAEIPIHFIGEAPAVKEQGGTLLKQIDALPVRCLPKDLIHYVEVDLSTLRTFDDIVHVADIMLPRELELLRGGDEVVVSVAAPREEKEEESAAVADEGAPAEAEKKDGDETTEAPAASEAEHIQDKSS